MVERPSQPHGGHGAAAAPERLDARAQALRDLALQALQEFTPQPAASLDLPALMLPPEGVAAACRVLRDDPRLRFQMLLCLTVVDYQDRFQLVYHLLSIEHNHVLVLKVDLADYEHPRVPSVAAVWPGAEWYEREAHDLFGVTFEGHPDLKPLLLWEGFEGYPGRKSYPFYDYQEW